MSEDILYLCPVCFRVCETDQECHQHRTLECCVGKHGDPCRRPLTNQFGVFVSRAPRWYLEARGLIPGWTPLKKE